MIFSKALSVFALAAVVPAVFAAPSSLRMAKVKRQDNSTDDDPQASLTLDPAVLQAHGLDDGQDVQEAGQVPSLVSGNNFINFCLTVDAPITDGQQLVNGSCNPIPMGVIPATDAMPSAKFIFPPNGDASLSENQTFTVLLAINNLGTGNFVNAEEKYYAAPQHLDGDGHIIGHSHVVIESLTSLTQSTPTDPRKFAFFKGLNFEAINGVLNATVPVGLFAGSYRICSINTAANHQPALGPVAQHGAFDDCSYFTVNPNNTAADSGAGNAESDPSTTTASAAASTSSASAGGNDDKTVTVKRGQNCAKIAKANGISLATFFSLNPQINKKCTNLEVGQQVNV